MPFYKTRSVVRDAERWTGYNQSFLTDKFGTDIEFPVDTLNDMVYARIWVDANREWLDLEVGEWIIRDSHGIYPCKDDVFHEKYERI